MLRHFEKRLGFVFDGRAFRKIFDFDFDFMSVLIVSGY